MVAHENESGLGNGRDDQENLAKQQVAFAPKALWRKPHNPGMTPAWKSGFGMFIGAAILIGYFFFLNPAKEVLVMAGVAIAWGGLWIFLQHRANQNSAREQEASIYPLPDQGDIFVLSRARFGWQQGLLVAQAGRLYWLAQRSGKPGKNLALTDDLAHTLQPLVELANLKRFRHIAGFFGGDSLDLFTEGKAIKLFLHDPEGLMLLLKLLEAHDPEASNSEA